LQKQEKQLDLSEFAGRPTDSQMAAQVDPDKVSSLDKLDLTSFLPTQPETPISPWIFHAQICCLFLLSPLLNPSSLAGDPSGRPI
jgi:hypothetical protein